MDETQENNLPLENDPQTLEVSQPSAPTPFPGHIPQPLDDSFIPGDKETSSPGENI